MAAGFSRIPVYEQGIDDIVGIVYAKDLMRAVRDERGDEPVRELVRPAHFVPETKRVAELLPEMQKQKSHMAIVVDEYGGTAGLVTLEDLIEELVGEIVDEYDVEEPPVEPLPDGDVRVNARMPIDELNELLDVELPRGRLGHRRRAASSTCSATCPRGRDGRLRRPPPAGRAGAGPAHRPGAHHQAEPLEQARSSPDDGSEVGLRHPRRPAQRRASRPCSTPSSARRSASSPTSPQTTRTEVRGVLTRPDAQVVFVDTPGIHKPRTTMGERLNATATAPSTGVDVVCLVIDATAPLGKGDRFVAARLPPDALCVVNKVDVAVPAARSWPS